MNREAGKAQGYRQNQDRPRTAELKSAARQNKFPVPEQHSDPNINSPATIVTHSFQTFCHEKRLHRNKASLRTTKTPSTARTTKRPPAGIIIAWSGRSVITR